MVRPKNFIRMRAAATIGVGLVLFLSAFLSFAQAQQPARLALLIGNQGYAQKVGSLKNPHNDVTLVEASLKRLGFKVTVLKDANYKSMDTALKRYVTEVRRAGAGAVSFFYYSGHGVANPETQINYLIPVDVAEADDDKIWFESFQQNAVIDLLSKQAANATHYVVFDACRSELRLTGAAAKGVGAQKGFVPVFDTYGLLVAYATAPRETASDAGVGGGPYAKVLAEELIKPGVEAVSMFRNVQIRVKQQIGQDPWLSFPSLPPVYLAGKSDVVATPPPAPPPPSRPQVSEAAEAWDRTKDSTSVAVLEAYIRRYGDTYYGDLAKVRLTELKQSEGEVRSKAEAERQRLALLQKEEERKRAAAETEARAKADAERQRLALLQKEEERKRAEAEARTKAEAERQRLALLATEEVRKRAEAAANAPRPAPSTYSSDHAEIVRAVQRELKRVGCYPGAIDGKWGAGGKEALRQFTRLAKIDLQTDDASEAALSAIVRQKARICPLVCGPAEVNKGGQCVAKQSVRAPKGDSTTSGGSAQPKEASPKQPSSSGMECVGMIARDQAAAPWCKK
jgi:uncharacterized caspase-like protein